MPYVHPFVLSHPCATVDDLGLLGAGLAAVRERDPGRDATREARASTSAAEGSPLASAGVHDEGERSWTVLERLQLPEAGLGTTRRR